ncbi:MAG: hypothetical protein GC139_01745 [Sideroxydans sp.]|nr:hypothetical protein [Sideroxydans sp.]
MNETMLKLVQGVDRLYPHELEQQFPRIMHKIIELWNTPQMEGYFTDLMVNSRGSERQGFPKKVASEIYYLSQVYDRTRNLPGSEDASPWANIDINKQRLIEGNGYQCTPQGFLKSAEAGDRATVSLFLSSGAEVDTRDERGWTPLMITAFNGNEEIAELLIRSGADVGIKDTAGYGPMHWAAFNGYANVIKLLIIKNADVNACSQHGWTPLLQGATRGHLAACGALIAGGANVNLASNDGWTPLHKACANGHIEVVKLLLAAKADRNAQHQDGVTPLALASKNKRTDIVSLLTTG